MTNLMANTSTISTAAKSTYGVRLGKLRTIAQQNSFDVIALVPGPTLMYLTSVSYHLSERPIILFIPASGDPAMLIPALELSKIADAAPFPIRFFSYGDGEGYHPAFEQVCKALGLANKRVAVEGLKMRVLEGQLLQRYAAECTVISGDDAVTSIRLYKEASEIAAMRKAITVSEEALEATLNQIRVGMTEHEVTNLLLNKMAELGSGGNAFDPIILSGPNSALPHGVPSDRRLQAGELLLFDFGTTFEGYPADITRTFAVGSLDAELRKVYDTVLAANEAGIRAIRPGVTAQDVDRAARQVIVDAGYGKYFLHRTGHGLGLDVHEAPNMVEGNMQVLEPGMVFTIEPGIYLSGRGGVRIEDNVVVTESGVDVLTTFSKAFRIITG